MNKYPYGLYLDSKIVGTALQIVSFYKNGIFDKNKTIVYVKKYKLTAKKYQRIFTSAGIPFLFMRPSELDALANQIIFYPFNAQSNCRFVANRKLKHVFITHGESNKVASVKPIIRIYDHVVMSGDLSIERYLKSGLFTQSDIDNGRLIKMGNTFVGKTGFSESMNAEQVIFYGPTWEGGLEHENYSSLGFSIVQQSLIEAARINNLKQIVIKPHPNTGHRCSTYINKLLKLIIGLRRSNIEVLLYSDIKIFSLQMRLYLKYLGVNWLVDLSFYRPVRAFVDISAMETQCLNENIPYNIFYKKDMLNSFIPSDFIDHYESMGLMLDAKNLDSSILLIGDFEKKFINKVIGYSQKSIKELPFFARVPWLANNVIRRVEL